MLLGCIIFTTLILVLGITFLGLWSAVDMLGLVSESIIMGSVLFLGIKCIIILGNFLDKIFQ